METFNGKYLKKYYYFAFILSVACVICMTLLGIFAFTKDTWSFGIIVLLALSFVLAVLAIISWVALYREEGRHHERWFPQEMLTELKKDQKSLQGQKKSLEEEISKLTAKRETLEKEKQELKEGETELAEERETLAKERETLEKEKQELKEGKTELAKERETLEKEKQELKEGKTELAKERETLAKEKQKLNEGETKLATDSQTLEKEKKVLRSVLIRKKIFRKGTSDKFDEKKSKMIMEFAKMIDEHFDESMDDCLSKLSEMQTKVNEIITPK